MEEKKPENSSDFLFHKASAFFPLLSLLPLFTSVSFSFKFTAPHLGMWTSYHLEFCDQPILLV